MFLTCKCYIYIYFFFFSLGKNCLCAINIDVEVEMGREVESVLCLAAMTARISAAWRNLRCKLLRKIVAEESACDLHIFAVAQLV